MSRKLSSFVSALTYLASSLFVFGSVIQDFESYDATVYLEKDLALVMPTASVSLEYDTGIGGGNAMHVAFDTSDDPWHSAIELNLKPLHLSNVSAVMIYVKQLSDCSNEDFEIQLKDAYGQEIARGMCVGTQTFDRMGFSAYSVDTTEVKNVSLARIAFISISKDGGTAHLAIDNISVVR
ncbi:hypothetical protein N9R65_02360 [Opitutales bacterium]|nr:hypothetical protein [Opitutales bacterium]